LKNPSCHNFEFQAVEGDEHQRLVCINWGEINYNNPKIVTGSLIVHKNKFLLAKEPLNRARVYGLFLQDILKETKLFKQVHQEKLMKKQQQKFISIIYLQFFL